jgi:hypothetical protein
MMDLVVFNGNDPQAGQIDLLVRSLRDPTRGDFNGRILLITTGISGALQELLARFEVQVFTSTMDDMRSKPLARVLGAYELIKADPQVHALTPRIADFNLRPSRLRTAVARFVERYEEYRATRCARRCHALPGHAYTQKQLAESFDLYMRKHFTKLILLEALEKMDISCERTLLLDSDILFQGPGRRIFDALLPNKLLVEYEKEPILGDHHIARSNRCAKHHKFYSSLKFGEGAHELNVGFVGGFTDFLRSSLEAWRSLMFESGAEDLFTCHTEDFWHEQDFFRLQHDLNPGHFAAAGKHLVYHAVHGAADDIEESAPLEFRLKQDGVAPCLVHFAGGYWKRFDSVSKAYRRAAHQI